VGAHKMRPYRLGRCALDNLEEVSAAEAPG
jgi:hypothetical protein